MGSGAFLALLLPLYLLLHACRKYQRPIWLTEFACPNPGGPDVASWQFLVGGWVGADCPSCWCALAWSAVSNLLSAAAAPVAPAAATAPAPAAAASQPMQALMPRPPLPPQVGALGLLDTDGWVERYAWYALETYGWLGEWVSECVSESVLEGGSASGSTGEGGVHRRRAGYLPGRQAGRRAGRRAGRQAGRRAGGRAGGQAGRQAGKSTPVRRVPSPLSPAGTSNSLMAPNSSTLTELGELYLSYRPVAAAAAAEVAAAAGAGQQQSGGSSKAADGATATAGPERAAGGRTEAAAATPGSRGASWSELCATCIQHLQLGRPLAALPAMQRSHCSQRCGLWLHSPGPAGRTACSSASLSAI